MAEQLPVPIEPRTLSPWADNAAHPPDSFVREERHVLDYLRVITKRRWTAIPTLLIVLAAVMLPSFLSVPIYEATSKVLIDAEHQNIIMFKEVVEQQNATADYYQTQYQILASRALARATIEKLKLWNHPLLGGGPSAAAKPPQAPAPGAETEAAESAMQAPIVDRFLSNLSVNPIRNSRLVEVKFRSSDPAFAATIANALAETYIARNLEFKFAASKDASDWLANQLEGQRKNVEQTELALQRYREQNNATSSADAELMQKLGGLTSAVMEAKTARIAREAAYKQLKDVENDPAAMAALPGIAGSAGVQKVKEELADLQRQEAQKRDQLGPLHPDMVAIRSGIQQAQKKLAVEVAAAAQAIESEYSAAQARERSLTEALEGQKVDVLASNRKAIGYAALERDAVSNRQIFEALLQRAKETGISGELKTNNIRIADPADVPRTPVWPRRQRDLLFGLMLGSVAALGMAFLTEYMDNKIKSPEEIRNLGLPCLGLVPKIPTKKRGGTAPLLNNGVPDSFAEAFRAVRSNVLFSASASAGTLVVTSTGPREGKSLVASNLAAGLAMAGHNVILIDVDMRRPRAHEIFDVPLEPGLSNALVSKTKASEIIHRSSIPNLWVVSAGKIPPNPAELLSSQAFRAWVNAVKPHFDWVVLDAPPVLAVTDASIVAHTAAGVIFVTSADMTDQQAALRAVEQLSAAKARFLGAVLNRVNLKRNAFFYAPYYRQEYTDYYARSSHS